MMPRSRVPDRERSSRSRAPPPVTGTRRRWVLGRPCSSFPPLPRLPSPSHSRSCFLPSSQGTAATALVFPDRAAMDARLRLWLDPAENGAPPTSRGQIRLLPNPPTSPRCQRRVALAGRRRCPASRRSTPHSTLCVVDCAARWASPAAQQTHPSASGLPQPASSSWAEPTWRWPHSKHHHCPSKLKKHSPQMLYCYSQLCRLILDLASHRCITSCSISLNGGSLQLQCLT
ncbi:uncharacterized protein LOC119295668 isoform X2 [Triticum dicoccoides]|uniref:uncharacterized protein LOC119295668 isoform X2 n=2 Tax=Triticum dicoccoides TaxID=85692 RepID=UPI001890515C|nr:uncharacterized protein LOC119295668 isoform X2 [Triticum dicoccoides]